MLDQTRQHSLSLHKALSQEWDSGCYDEHKMCFFLNDPSISQHLRHDSLILNVGLPSVGTRSKHLRWRETQIHCADDASENLTPFRLVKLWTGWLLSRANADWRTYSSLLECGPKAPRFGHVPPPPGIKSGGCKVCSIVKDKGGRDSCLDLSLSMEGNLSQLQVPKQEPRVPRRITSRYVTLEGILKSPLAINAWNWSWKQQMSLAFKLAASLLQFHSTPWIQEAYLKRNIYFPYIESSDPEAEAFIEIDHPFIFHTFTRRAAKRKSRKPVAEQSLLDLAVTLLELFHEQSVEDYARNKNMTLDGTYKQHFYVAKKWIKTSRRKLVPPLLEAIRRCVNCTFQRSNILPNWNDAAFRTSFCEEVVKPLWDMCHSQDLRRPSFLTW